MAEKRGVMMMMNKEIKLSSKVRGGVGSEIASPAGRAGVIVQD